MTVLSSFDILRFIIGGEPGIQYCFDNPRRNITRRRSSGAETSPGRSRTGINTGRRLS